MNSAPETSPKSIEELIASGDMDAIEAFFAIACNDHIELSTPVYDIEPHCHKVMVDDVGVSGHGGYFVTSFVNNVYASWYVTSRTFEGWKEG